MSPLLALCAALCASVSRGGGLQDPPIVGDGGLFQTLDGEGWALASSDGAVSVGGVVPGDLLTDLQRAGVIGDPLYEKNFDAYDDSGHVQPPLWERSNFTYSNSFTLDTRVRALAAGGEILLVLDGVKMAAEVFLNGVSLGVTANQFLRMTAPVAALLKDGEGANSLSVVFLPSMDAVNNNARFMACSGGWDWAPYTGTVLSNNNEQSRTFSKGIWKSVVSAPRRCFSTARRALVSCVLATAPSPARRVAVSCACFAAGADAGGAARVLHGLIPDVPPR